MKKSTAAAMGLRCFSTVMSVEAMGGLLRVVRA